MTNQTNPSRDRYQERYTWYKNICQTTCLCNGFSRCFCCRAINCLLSNCEIAFKGDSRQGLSKRSYCFTRWFLGFILILITVFNCIKLWMSWWTNKMKLLMRTGCLLCRGGSRYGPIRPPPPFWQLNHTNSVCFGAIPAIFPSISTLGSLFLQILGPALLCTDFVTWI